MQKLSAFKSLLFFGCMLLASPLYANMFKLFPKGEKPALPVFLALLIFALFVAIAVHELGHLVAGLLQGFRFELFIVGLLGVRRTEKGIQVFLNKNAGLMGGIAATIPTEQSNQNSRKFARSVLAGPVASLVFAVVFFAVMPFANTLFRAFFLIAGATSFGLFFATTLPKKSGIYFSDRARYQRLISKGKAGEAEEALLQIITQTTIDGSCKNVSLHHTKLLQEDAESFIRFWGYYYEYKYYYENGMIKEAATAKTKLIEQKATIPKQVWKALKVDDDAVPVSA